MTTPSALERVIRRAGSRTDPTVERQERCELCSEPVPTAHRHLLDTDTDQALCCCHACSLLFDRDAASDRHYRLLPQRRTPVASVDPSLLGVPVGLAFFVVRDDGAVRAHYPSPAGATQWEVEPGAWAEARRACPALDGVTPRIEALLVDTTTDRREAWLVPLDDCYRLVAIVRREWRGLSGGDRVRPAIEEFFDELRRADGEHPGR